ncbi:MAG: hypothetical protein AAGF27_10135, partial [Pseudomonadota bacterium]
MTLFFARSVGSFGLPRERRLVAEPKADKIGARSPVLASKLKSDIAMRLQPLGVRRSPVSRRG